MRVSVIKKAQTSYKIWYRTVYEAIRAGLQIGGVLYGGIVLPFFLTAPYGFDRLIGIAIVGVVVSILVSLPLSLISGAMAGMMITVLHLFSAKHNKFYAYLVSFVNVSCAIEGMIFTLTILHKAPYYAYATFNWKGSDVALIVFAGISAIVASRRFMRWYGKQPTLTN